MTVSLNVHGVRSRVNVISRRVSADACHVTIDGYFRPEGHKEDVAFDVSMFMPTEKRNDFLDALIDALQETRDGGI
jgi:hypothetical protein